MKVKETAKKPYGICPASMTIWNADQTYNKKGMEKYLTCYNEDTKDTCLTEHC